MADEKIPGDELAGEVAAAGLENVLAARRAALASVVLTAFEEALDAIDARGVSVVRISIRHADGTAWESEARNGAVPEPDEGVIARAVERRKALAARLKRVGGG